MVIAARHKLFGTGRYTPAQATLAALSEVVLAVEGISIQARSANLKMPGTNRSSSRRLLVGSIVITTDRALLAIGEWRPPEIMLAVASTMTAATLFLESTGPRLHIDAAQLAPGCDGIVDLTFREPLAPDQLGRVTAVSATVAMSTVDAQVLSRRL